jgi:hypothetical protein
MQYVGDILDRTPGWVVIVFLTGTMLSTWIGDRYKRLGWLTWAVGDVVVVLTLSPLGDNQALLLGGTFLFAAVVAAT